MSVKGLFLPGWALAARAYHTALDGLAEQGAEIAWADYRDCHTPQHFLDSARDLLPPDGRSLLVAHSLGTLIALYLAAALPERVRALVLIAPTARFTPQAPSYPAGFSPRVLERMKKKVLGECDTVLKEFAAACLSAPEREAAPAVLSAPDLLVSNEYADSLLAGLSALSEWDMRPLLKDIRCPVVMLRGQADPICPAEAGHYLAEHLRPLSDIVFPLSGHLPFLTVPEFTPRLLNAAQAALELAHAR